MNSHDDEHACTTVEAEFRAVSGVCSGLVEGLSQLLIWKDQLLASSAELPAKSLISLAMISSNLHRSQTQLSGSLRGLRKARLLKCKSIILNVPASGRPLPLRLRES
jgi:hypothetical protein